MGVASPAPGRMLIAGGKSDHDWHKFREKLIPGGDPGIWSEAFNEYFYERLKTRYLDPIAMLQKNGTLAGEGFSIVAIQCTLIEFLASALEGSKYRYKRNDQPHGPHEYSNSGELYVRFLSKTVPFKSHFDEAAASDFYASVRCGLLHEARTKNGWLIQAKSSASRPADTEKRIVFRDDFQAAICEFIRWYGEALCSTIPLQEAFVRKFDDLCL
jgi:hypothetical protein